MSVKKKNWVWVRRTLHLHCDICHTKKWTKCQKLDKFSTFYHATASKISKTKSIVAENTQFSIKINREQYKIHKMLKI